MRRGNFTSGTSPQRTRLPTTKLLFGSMVGRDAALLKVYCKKMGPFSGSMELLLQFRTHGHG